MKEIKVTKRLVVNNKHRVEYQITVDGITETRQMESAVFCTDEMLNRHRWNTNKIRENDFLTFTEMDAIKKAMLTALKENYGRVTRSCEAVDIARQTHYNWLKDDPEYKEAVEAIDEAAIDHVESKLFERIDGVTVSKGVNEVGEAIVYDVPPSDTAIIFYLKTKGKKRGYIERQEITGADGPVVIKIESSIWTSK